MIVLTCTDDCDYVTLEFCLLSAWKAVRSVATVTGYEVPGKA